MSYENGYICGVLCGSGHIVCNEKKGNYGISIESKNTEALHFFANCLQKAFGAKTKTSACKRPEKTGSSETLYCYSKEVSDTLIDAFEGSFGARSWLPPKKTQANPVFRAGFLRGFFDHKGSVRIRYKKSGVYFDKVRNIRASSVNLRGLFAIKELLLLEGIQSTIYRCKTLNILDIEGKNRLEKYRERINFTSSEKKKRLEKAIMFMTPDEKRLGKRAANPV